MKSKYIVVTTGDIDGIGFEVATKALVDIYTNNQNIFKNNFIVFASENNQKLYFDLLKKHFKLVWFKSLSSALQYKTKDNELLLVNDSLPPARQVEEAALHALDNKNISLVTAPLSKPEIIAAGLKDLGHTDIFKRVSKSAHTYMTFLGSKFNVSLNTGHIPISEVATKLSLASLKNQIDLINSVLIKKNIIPDKPIGLLALNPHAGDQGLIGQDEKMLFDLISNAPRDIKISGPLVPDAAFVQNNHNKYSIYLALYHDQGLIPFKMAHGYDSGVHLTLGIPFIRTSVDHGTAKDIFGKDLANPNSMRDALLKCVELANKLGTDKV